MKNYKEILENILDWCNNNASEYATDEFDNGYKVAMCEIITKIKNELK